MPDTGEQVLCLFLPLNNGLSLGFVLGAFYSLIDRPPVADSGKTVINFEDGSRLIYDKEYGDLAMHIKGSVTIAANGPLTCWCRRCWAPCRRQPPESRS